MHFLRSSAVTLAVIIVPFACQPMGLLTPYESFSEIKRAALSGDTDKLISLLSRDSIVKIKATLDDLKKLKDEQAESVSRIYGIKPGLLRNLTLFSFVKIYMQNENNVLLEALKLYPVEIDVKGPRAVIRVENGMKIFFAKEGPYWKLDLTKL